MLFLELVICIDMIYTRIVNTVLHVHLHREYNILLRECLRDGKTIHPEPNDEAFRELEATCRKSLADLLKAYAKPLKSELEKLETWRGTKRFTRIYSCMMCKSKCYSFIF